MLTKNSKLGDVLAHPLGRDVIHRLLLQMGVSRQTVDNPLVRRLPLSSLPRLTGGCLDGPFVSTLVTLLNSETARPGAPTGRYQRAWWKEAVFYQIYPKSFCDSNGDGIGDLPGILDKLDYLQDLGVDALWLSPIYDSPMADNGYDIRDYTKLLAEYGTLEDFRALLTELHRRGMKLIMDLVINHTSDEHPWFQTALADSASPQGNYYIFRDQPNNWTSFFGGSAWKYFPELNQWALHLFSDKQMDLNWEDPALRRELHTMIRDWLELGVDGFRLDVINYISKAPELPDGNPAVGKLLGYYGIEHYFYGPHLHDHLRELHTEAFAPYGAFTVGEAPGIGRQGAKLITGFDRGELDLVFTFDHLMMPGKDRFDDYRYDLNYLKHFYIEWMEDGPEWLALFLENHDNPRPISVIDPDPAQRGHLAKLLAMILLTLRGTPFLFQGQELGSINQDFTDITQLRDVESLNFYDQWRRTMGDEAAFRKVLNGTRDHARTPMPWTADRHGGFTTGNPWILLDEDHKIWNAGVQRDQPDSVLNFYRELIALRKAHPALIYGNVRFRDHKIRDRFTWERTHPDETLLVECNLSAQPIRREASRPFARRLLANYPDEPGNRLRPYEAILWQLED